MFAFLPEADSQPQLTMQSLKAKVGVADVGSTTLSKQHSASSR